MFRSSIATVNQTAIYEQTGGIVNIGGTGQTDNNFARFSLPIATHTFIMSGGELNIVNPTNIGFLALGSGPGYFNVSGGTVNLTLPGGDLDRNIAARPPLFNLTISKSGTGQAALSVSDIAGIGNQPLSINNNLVLQNNALLRMNNNDLNIAGNFTLAAGARYIPGTNTTRFFWHSTSNNAGTTISIADNTGVSPMEFHNLFSG
jgi:fibronectin-binding autotransporter adhesin